MKKLFLLSFATLMLTSCGFVNAIKENDGGKTESSDNPSEVQLPSIESLNSKYNGFEVHYTTTNTNAYIGAKGDLYWVYVTDYDNPDDIQSNSIISEKVGSEWINYYYTSNDKFETYGTSKDTCVAGNTANVYYIQYMLNSLDSYSSTSVTLKGEAAYCYQIGFGTMNVYVNVTDGYTMQVTYSGDNSDQSIMFSEVRKGSAVEAPEYKENE